MDTDEVDPVVFVTQHSYILRVTFFCWRLIAYVMGFGGIIGGLFIQFGPPGSQGAIPFRLLAGLDVPNTLVVWLMIVGGALIFWRRTTFYGHMLLGICYGWWAGVIPYAMLFLDQNSSLNAVGWALTLSVVHFIAGGGRAAIWQYMRKLPPTPGGSQNG